MRVLEYALTEKDYLPIDGYPFQRWGERSGPPYSEIRPLREAAARRAWERALRSSTADGDGALPRELFPSQSTLDLRAERDWDAPGVRAWLLARVDDGGQRVLVSYGPQWAVEVEWRLFCDHWLVFLWVSPCAVYPADESWVLWFWEDRFVVGERAPSVVHGG